MTSDATSLWYIVKALSLTICLLVRCYSLLHSLLFIAWFLQLLHPSLLHDCSYIYHYSYIYVYICTILRDSTAIRSSLLRHAKEPHRTQNPQHAEDRAWRWLQHDIAGYHLCCSCGTHPNPYVVPIDSHACVYIHIPKSLQLFIPTVFHASHQANPPLLYLNHCFPHSMCRAPGRTHWKHACPYYMPGVLSRYTHHACH